MINKTIKKSDIFLVFFVFAFSVLMRLIWVYQFQDTQSFFWNSELMINTNDGYYYAEGARDILSGSFTPNDRSPIGDPLSMLTAFLSMSLPFSFETIILYMPALFGSLLVIPLFFIGKYVKNMEVGFVAALLGSVAWSYYNRTMTGYYDTDMLVIVLPTMVIFSVILASISKRNHHLALITISMMLSSSWYVSSYSLNIAILATVFVYTLLFERKNIYFYKILLFMGIAVMLIPFLVKIILVTLLYLWFHFKPTNNIKIIVSLFGVTLLGIIITGGLGPIINRLDLYVFRSEPAVDNAMKLHFFGVAQTVREAGKIPFELFANRISGDIWVFLLSIIGYGLMIWKHRIMILTLPMLGLGFLAYWGGLRFTVYAVPVMALGYGYLIYFFNNQVKEDSHKLIGSILLLAIGYLAFIVKLAYIPQQTAFSLSVFSSASTYYWENYRFIFTIQFILTLVLLYSFATKRYFRESIIVFWTFLALSPNIMHIVDYKVPVVFDKQEVQVLDDFKKLAKEEDYTLAWWDYGYPIRYYSNVKTLIDGGKHEGNSNYPVSFSLMENQDKSSKMARLAVEYTESQFLDKRKGSHIEQMMEDNNISDPNDFLLSLSQDQIKLPDKTREIYYFLPLRMLDILPTVDLFSNIDLSTGEQLQRSFFFQSSNIKQNGAELNLGGNMKLDMQNAIAYLGEQKVAISSFYTTEYDKNGRLNTKVQIINKSAPLNVVFMKNFNRILVVDHKMLNSTYIQLYVLENYDKKLFEPIILNPMAKIFRLKK